MIKLSKKTVDILKWILIIGLFALLLIQGFAYNKVNRQLVTSEEYNKKNMYARIYESTKLSELKKQNRELYDSISKLKDVESGMIIKFREHYNTDTITVDKFIVQHDTITNEKIDSIYHYAQSNDTIDLDIDIKANELKWVVADFTIRDKFVIINREKDGVNQTIINHSDNSEIEGTAMWHKKENKKWYQRFTIGPQIGVGYGLIHKKIDGYVGVGIGYQLSK